MPSAEEAPRSLTDYLAIIRRRAWLTALVAVVTVGGAAAYTFRQPTLYRASMKIVIGQQGGAFQLNVGNVAGTFTQTMSDLLQSDVVAKDVIDRLYLGLVEPREPRLVHPCRRLLRRASDRNERAANRDEASAHAHPPGKRPQENVVPARRRSMGYAAALQWPSSSPSWASDCSSPPTKPGTWRSPG